MKNGRHQREYLGCGQSRDCSQPPPVAAEDAPEQPCLLLAPSPEESAQIALQAALEKHTKELAERPESAWAWYRYGDTLLALKRPAEAVPALRKAVALSPEIALFHYDLGLALYDLNESEAASKEFAGIVAEDPELKHAWSNLMIAAMTNLALSQEKLGRADEAIETLLPAMDTALGILFNLGFLHFRAKRFEAALPYAHAAYVLRPNNEDVVHQYGTVLMEVKRLREAVKILKEATELNPSCCGAWYDLGLACARQKLLKRARVCFLRAQAVDPGRPWPYYDLACLDALEGKRDAAFRNLWSAVERGFLDAGYLRRDKDFRTLRRDKRWKELIEMMVQLENAKN
jgi:tetratricopeptide (TPR) repeat protein